MKLQDISIRLGMLLLFVLCLAGCGSGKIGTEDNTINGSHDVIVLNSDGTYDQAVTCSSGNVWHKTGEWETPGPGSDLPPEVKTDGSYINLKNTYDVSDGCSTTKPPPVEAFAVEPRSMFSLSPEEYQSQMNSIKGWATALRILFFVFWVWMIIDVVRRNFNNVNTKTGWVLCVVLLYCLGALIYFVFGRSAGSITANDASRLQ